MHPLKSLVEYLNGYLGIPAHPDYPNALNGLQFGDGGRVSRVGAAVDASEAVITDAAAREVDLLLVHHGLFWGGLQPLTGRHFRKVSAMVEAGVALYAAHLPLDGHAEVGNCALLADALEVERDERFGEYQGSPLGWMGRPSESSRDQLIARCEAVLEGPVQLLAGGPTEVSRVAVVTGAGGSFIQEAARAGVDTLVTGEGAHHHFTDAHELGVNVILGGHYRTETFGVRALAAHLEAQFGVEWVFLDHPSGL